MRLIGPDVGSCRALVVDSNPSLRSMQATMLREMGVGRVTQASRADDARRALVQARDRETVLRSSFEAIEAGHFAKGSALCRARFSAPASTG